VAGSGRYLVAAGGTGGHIFPGIAVADALRARDASARVVFVGTERGLESRLVPRAGYALELLPVLPLNGVGLARALRGLLALPRAFWRAAALLRRERPAAVLGVGGYAGGPIVLAAALSGVRTVILEPNARPGFTNRVLRPFVARAACAFDSARRYYGARGVLTGNPVRGGFARIAPREPRAPFTLLVFGGSQGSRALNEAMVAALSSLPPAAELHIVHQTGPAAHAEVAAAYAAARREAEVAPFLDDMEAQLAAADLVLCRAGATTCAELCAAGRAAVLVPLPGAADDHQRENACAMQRAGAARMLAQAELDGARLASELRTLFADPAALAQMGKAARGLARADAAERVAALLRGEEAA
jgi:UDP-N-acetylglucosamine--N-acetylmuramyl-(pentapeptide) pyrophosphoryl-undecaprenol N-acetylglucosamine transferase